MLFFNLNCSKSESYNNTDKFAISQKYSRSTIVHLKKHIDISTKGIVAAQTQI